MSAMEKMLGSMLGVDTKELGEMANKLSNLIAQIASNMQAINESQLEIIERLERIENGNSDNSGTGTNAC